MILKKISINVYKVNDKSVKTLQKYIEEKLTRETSFHLVIIIIIF